MAAGTASGPRLVASLRSLPGPLRLGFGARRQLRQPPGFGAVIVQPAVVDPGCGLMLEPAVGSDGGFDRFVAQRPADDLVLAGVPVEMPPGSKVPQQMGVDLRAD